MENITLIFDDIHHITTENDVINPSTKENGPDHDMTQNTLKTSEKRKTVNMSYVHARK